VGAFLGVCRLVGSADEIDRRVVAARRATALASRYAAL
jgi:hypothetical protein